MKFVSPAAALALIALTAAPLAGASTPPAPPPEAADIPVTLLVDSGSGRVLYAHQPDQRFLPASMTKVMTLYVAFEEIAKGRLDRNRQFTVSDATAREWNGSGTSLYLKGGDTVTLDTLMRGIATVSANDASVVLAEGYSGSVPNWIGLMNAEADKLGMRDSRFATPNGWPDGGATYVSANDLVKLASALIARHPDDYQRYFGQKRMMWQGVMMQSHDPTVGIIRGADGIKTGHTKEAGYNFLGSASRDGRRLVLVVAGAKTEAQRAAASRALLEWGYSAWRSRPLFNPGQTVAEARVQGGDARRVALVADRPIAAVMPAATQENIRLRVIYKGPIAAPIAKNAEVARLEIKVGDAPASQIPLRAARSVGEAGLIDRLVNGLYGLIERFS